MATPRALAHRSCIHGRVNHFKSDHEFLGARAFVRIRRRDASRRARHGRCSGRVLRRALAREMVGTGVRAGGFQERASRARRSSGGAHARGQGGVGVVRWDHRGEKRARESVVACVFVSGSVSGVGTGVGTRACGGAMGSRVRGTARVEPRDAK